MKRDVGPDAPGHYLEANFFDGADRLRARLEEVWEGNAGDCAGPFSRVDAGEAYSFLMATAERVFSHNLALAFLSRLREWGLEHLGARHASTPQIHVYLDGCARSLAPDASPARHHYLYSLTPGDGACIRILGSGNRRESFWRLRIQSLASVQLRFNNLLVHKTSLAYGIEGLRGAKGSLEAAVLLHGYIW